MVASNAYEKYVHGRQVFSNGPAGKWHPLSRRGFLSKKVAFQRQISTITLTRIGLLRS
jgi:hypothetical protein